MGILTCVGTRDIVGVIYIRGRRERGWGRVEGWGYVAISMLGERKGV